MNKKDFFYDLPPHLIAQTAAEPRDSARLLCLEGVTGAVTDRVFSDLPDLLQKGDLLVLNNTRVLPARIFGTKQGTGAAIEFLLHKRLNLTDFLVLARPAKRLKIADKIDFSPRLSAEIIGIGEEGERKVRFVFDGVFEEILKEIGQLPLPPYIKNQPDNPERYQTVYSKTEGSSAAPTAGLHFTPQLLEKLKDKGIEFAEVLLHVGLGTFLPVKTDDILAHKMHSEYYSIDQTAAQKINQAKQEGRRVIAVGTTSVRVLESVASANGRVEATSGDTQIFIYPPYKFKVVDGLITNFHLPESTLIMLVSALIGKEKTMEIYAHAVQQNYRFFSFGDACLFL